VKPEGPDAPKPDAAKPAAKVPDVRIDVENITQRILAMPLPPRRYVGLEVGKAGVLFAIEQPQPAAGQPPTLTVHRHDLKTRKPEVAVAGCGSPRFRSMARRC